MVLVETQVMYHGTPFLLPARTACQKKHGKMMEEAQLHTRLAIPCYFG